MSVLNVCMVGVAGTRAERLVATVRSVPGLDAVACCDIDAEACARCAEQNGLRYAFTDYGDALAHDDLDLIVISTPDYLHGEQTLAAIEAGKHVYVEVPLCDTTLEDCAALVRAAERNRVKVQMGNQTRWWPSYRTLKHYVSTGALGQIIYAESEYWHNLHHGGNWFRLNADLSFQTDPPVWRTGFGYPAQRALSSGGMHALDSLRWVLDEQFTEVTCYTNDHGLVPCPGYTDEHGFAAALFRSESGGIVRVSEAFTLIRRYSLGASVFGTEGSLEMDRRLFSSFPPDTELGLYLTTREAHERDAKAPAQRIDPVAVPVPDAMCGGGAEDEHPGAAALALADLVEAVHADRQPLINVYEAARSSACAICARASARERRPVHIPSFFQRMA